MSETITIGSWEFSPTTGLLSRGDDQRRLENRTASLLEYLCHSDGELVSHSEIIDHVWNGRFVSPNSVAVVIADIRRALEDDARNPTYIETLPKRGYRLVAQVILVPEVKQPANASGSKSRWRWLFGAVALVALTLAVLSQTLPSRNASSNPVLVSISPIENETNDMQYSPLASAISELVSVELMRQNNFQISPRGDADIRISGKLIIWDGHPAVSLHAASISNGRTFWSGMASGPESKLPQQVRSQISKLANEVTETPPD